jgi:hypothetical protein
MTVKNQKQLFALTDRYQLQRCAAGVGKPQRRSLAMSKSIDRQYYARRIAEENARAAMASDRAAAAVHRELARMYEVLLASEHGYAPELNQIAA